VLRDQARLACPGDSLGTVGHAELAQHMVDVLQRRDRVDDLGEILPEARAAPPPHRMARSRLPRRDRSGRRSRAYLAAAKESALVPAPG